MSQAETLFPGFGRLWKQIKAETGTRQARPKSLTFTDVPSPVYLDDHECGRRWALDLESMKLSEALHVSGGDWACHAGSNNDQQVRGIPANMAVVSVAWNDYYRSFSVEIQVAKLAAQMVA